MKKTFQVVSPVDGSVYCERSYASDTAIEQALDLALKVQRLWKHTSIDDRARICQGVVQYFEENVAEIAKEITWQMGRPIAYSPFEILKGFKERAMYMVGKAAGALEDVQVEPLQGFDRFIRKEPIGTVVVLSPWNYPYLTPVNVVIPAIMAGNPVILKHAEQTPICAERFQEAFQYAGAPEGLFQYLHLTHEQIPSVIQDGRISGVFFTGSVEGGRSVRRAAHSKFLNMGFELGGKDPAYVARDAEIGSAIENLVDGAYFNSGQSCCGIERIYVHTDVFDDFVAGFKTLTEQYIVGNPTDPKVTMGPLVRRAAAENAQKQMRDAELAGALPLIDTSQFASLQLPYLAPQAYLEVDHKMDLMSKESFAPVVGIKRVRSDEEAVDLMNDSDYGLTASIWTKDVERALEVGDQIETGTWFMNRCDYLDPALAWTGVKESGNGCTLSTLGYSSLTRPKSFHLKLPS